MSEEPVEILLVEDNASHAEMTVRTLRRNNISNHIHVVRDGAEAIEFLFTDGEESRPVPRVILLDLKLPKVDGIDVLRRVKGDRRMRAIPVVVLTSSHEDADLHACYALGVNSYIVKPVDFQQFSDAVRSLGLYWVLLNNVPHGDNGRTDHAHGRTI
jgi:two-component system, response regulator